MPFIGKMLKATGEVRQYACVRLLKAKLRFRHVTGRYGRLREVTAVGET